MIVQTHNSPIVLDHRRLEEMLGSAQGPERSRGAGEKLQELIDAAMPLISPRIGYTTCPLISSGDLPALENGTIFKSRKLARMLRHSSAVLCFLVTIGDGIEQKIDSCTRSRKTADAYIFDTIGSAAAEYVVDSFQDRYRRSLEREGSTTTLRFSPGYCDWPLTDQKKLFSLLDAERVGVTLSESCLMTPRKSVSGVFGIQSCDHPRYNPCSECGRLDCKMRRDDTEVTKVNS